MYRNTLMACSTLAPWRRPTSSAVKSGSKLTVPLLCDMMCSSSIDFVLPAERILQATPQFRRFVLVQPRDASGRNSDVPTGNASARHVARSSLRTEHANALVHDQSKTSPRPLRSKIKHSNDGNHSSESQQKGA